MNVDGGEEEQERGGDNQHNSSRLLMAGVGREGLVSGNSEVIGWRMYS